MHYDADTSAEYTAAFNELRRQPLLGTHTIGDLTLTVGPSKWNLTDGHGNNASGQVTTGPATREKINKALHTWLERTGIR